MYRWDLDKTYLRTEFDTALDLLRTAIEPVARKRAFPGAAALLREQAATCPRRVFILSGSPEQMRPVLEAKLRLDGIRWDEFVLKPSLRNLLRGRVRFVREQVGYKLGALLASQRTQWEPPSAPTSEVLFGDDAEADAFVYSLYADICAGRVNQDQLAAVLQEAEVYPKDTGQLLRDALAVQGSTNVRIIFIHLARVSPHSVFEPYGARVCPIYNYFQPACVLVHLGALAPLAALRVGAELVQGHAFGPDVLIASFMDMVRRGFASAETAEALRDAAQRYPGRSPYAPAMARFGESLEERRPDLKKLSASKDPPPMSVDYLSAYRSHRENRRALKDRVRFRRGR